MAFVDLPRWIEDCDRANEEPRWEHVDNADVSMVRRCEMNKTLCKALGMEGKPARNGRRGGNPRPLRILSPQQIRSRGRKKKKRNACKTEKAVRR